MLIGPRGGQTAAESHVENVREHFPASTMKLNPGNTHSNSTHVYSNLRAAFACSLVSGDCKGRHASLFAKVASLNASHGPFAALFCVGQFFGDTLDELTPFLTNATPVPIPTYFVSAEESSCGQELLAAFGAQGGALCPNLHFLGRSGVREIEGLRVAFLSGVYSADSFRAAPVTVPGKVCGLFPRPFRISRIVLMPRISFHFPTCSSRPHTQRLMSKSCSALLVKDSSRASTCFCRLNGPATFSLRFRTYLSARLSA